MSMHVDWLMISLYHFWRIDRVDLFTAAFETKRNRTDESIQLRGTDMYE